MKAVFVLFFLFICFVVQASVSGSSEIRSTTLIIDDAVIPATIVAAPVAAGYLTIRNEGDEVERLVSVSAAFAGNSQIHTVKMINGVMKMRPLPRGLTIPAGSSVVLKKGSNHLMFMKLEEQMKAGETRKVVLGFEKAGDVEITMRIVDPYK